MEYQAYLFTTCEYYYRKSESFPASCGAFTSLFYFVTSHISVQLHSTDTTYFQEYGDTIAFGCCELDLVLSEVKKVENWKKTCMDKLGASVKNENSLLHALEKVLIWPYFPLHDPFTYHILRTLLYIFRWDRL